MNITRLAAAMGGLLAYAAVVAVLAVVAIRCTPVRAEGPVEVDVAIVFLVDTSFSMDSYELEIARQSHVEAFRSADVLAAIAGGNLGRIAVAYVEFGGWATSLVDWTVIGDAVSAEAFAADLDAKPITNTPRTGIGAAMIEAARQFDRLPHPTFRLVVDIVGDGINSANTPLVYPARNALLDRGVVINGMPLMLLPSEGGLDRYYEEKVIGGPGAFSMPLTRIEQMPAALRQKIIAELF